MPGDQDSGIPNRSSLFLVPPVQCPHQREENLPSQSEPLLPQALVDPAVSRGKMGEQEREGPGAAGLSGTAMESRPSAQKRPSTSVWSLWRGQRCLEKWYIMEPKC